MPSTTPPGGGYAGRLLFVDLTRRRVEARPLDPTLVHDYLGGLGFGARLFLDLIEEQLAAGRPLPEPLAPENPFLIMAGPLTGVRLNAVARWTVCARSPQTGLWGEANVGGFFGAELKVAGWDGIVVTGAAEAPVYLRIEDGTATLEDAGTCWGLDTYQTEDRLHAELRGAEGAAARKPGQVLAIGPAGESLVRFASLVNHRGHVAGRTGLGAVWGAKKLKAVFVRGSGRVPVADPDSLAALRAELEPVYDESIAVAGLRTSGTAIHMDLGVMMGDIPMKNWRLTEWDEFDALGPLAYAERLLVGRSTCFACGVQCKREAQVTEGPFRFDRGPGPEYETIATFGTMCLNPDIEAVGRANDLCNRLGMDTISCGSTIAWALDCWDHGLLDAEATGGLELTWGNAAAIVRLAEAIGLRQGFGDLLAEGSERAAAQLGGGSEALLTTIKGLEAPMHDPRSCHGYALAYAVSPRGACHMASLDFPVESGGMYLEDVPELAAETDPLSPDGKALLNVVAQDYGMFFSSCAVFCNLGAMVLSADHAVRAVSAVTGLKLSLDDAMTVGRRLWYLKRGLSHLFGATAADDRLPALLATPLDGGPTAGSSPDLDSMLREFYQLRGLDETGLPRPEVLQGLGLGDLADLLLPPERRPRPA